MIFIRRFDGKAQAKVDHTRTDDIGHGLNAVCDQGERVPNEPGCALEQGEDEVEANAN
jgi:hypothetical protein